MNYLCFFKFSILSVLTFDMFSMFVNKIWDHEMCKALHSAFIQISYTVPALLELGCITCEMLKFFKVIIVFFPSTVWRKLVQVRWYKNKKQKREWQAPWDDCCFGVVQIKWNWIERKKGRGCGHRLNKRGELLNESSFRVFTDTSTDWGLVNSCIPCVTVRQCITTLLKMMGYHKSVGK